ncbi:MAG: HIT domain-containing protein [Candidatus Micrarchaeales archaeon]
MKKTKCIFCRIASGEIPAYKIYEDSRYVAFLDMFPNIEGQTLVVPKKHMVSLFSMVDDRNLADFMIVTKKVANLIRRKLGVARVHAVLEGTGINHLHAKLYPTSGLTNTVFEEIIAGETIYFNKYPGYVTTLMGPKASDFKLRKLQKRIAKQTSMKG